MQRHPGSAPRASWRALLLLLAVTALVVAPFPVLGVDLVDWTPPYVDRPGSITWLLSRPVGSVVRLDPPTQPILILAEARPIRNA